MQIVEVILLEWKSAWRKINSAELLREEENSIIIKGLYSNGGAVTDRWRAIARTKIQNAQPG